MSIGLHRLDTEELGKSVADLYRFLGAHDTPQLYAEQFKIDVGHDIPAGGGNSVDRKTVYIDRRLYQDVISGKIKVRGLLPWQIIYLWVEHEHTEIVIIDGDNPIDSYLPAHECAQRKEHKDAAHIIGLGHIAEYEIAIRPALDECYNRDFFNPPKDLWCGPYLDSKTPRDDEILRKFRALGVEDAFKRGKYEVHYGIGPDICGHCKNYNHEKLEEPTGPCAEVSGTVRRNRYCDYWLQAEHAKPEKTFDPIKGLPGIRMNP